MPSENRRDAVPWIDIVRFVRQLSHDLRNNLNAAELQSANIDELAAGTELKSEIKRLREMIAKIGASLQRLTAGLAQINPTKISYRAADFMDDLKQKIAKDFLDDGANVIWDVQLGDATFEIDPQLLQQAFLELFTNAFQHGRSDGALATKAYADNNRFAFVLREPKAGFDLSMDNWGREPLHRVSQGHYGLGLNRVRAILEAQGGELCAQYDPSASALLTTVTLPLSETKQSS